MFFQQFLKTVKHTYLNSKLVSEYSSLKNQLYEMYLLYIKDKCISLLHYKH